MQCYFFCQIRCTSQIHNIYSQKTEKVIEQEKPKQVHTPSNNINFVQNSIPYDSYNYGDFYDKKDSHLTHIKGKHIFLFHFPVFQYCTTHEYDYNQGTNFDTQFSHIKSFCY